MPKPVTPPPHPDDQLSQIEVADLIGVTPAHLRVMRVRDQFEEPDGVIGVTPWWRRRTVDRWLKQRASERPA